MECITAHPEQLTRNTRWRTFTAQVEKQWKHANYTHASQAWHAIWSENSDEEWTDVGNWSV